MGKNGQNGISQAIAIKKEPFSGCAIIGSNRRSLQPLTVPVEAVPDSAAKELKVVSAYMSKTNGSTDRLLNVPQSDPQPTSKTPDGAYASASVNSIPKTAQDVNPVLAEYPLAQRMGKNGQKGISQAIKAEGDMDTSAAKTASMEEAVLPKMTMADFTDVNSSAWRNVDYADTETKRQITQDTHRQMVSDGQVVQIPESTAQQVGQSFPDLRTQKKADRVTTLRQRMAELKEELRQFLGGMKGASFEFEVNGNVLEATLYGTGISEVMEKVTKDKAAMLYHSEQIFKGAQYLYSTPDYNGDPNIYRWNYFYTPVQIGDGVVGVRIAVRDMVKQQESQIYNWGIKKDITLDGEGDGMSRKPLGVSSVVSSMDSIPQTAQDVKGEMLPRPAGADKGAALGEILGIQKEETVEKPTVQELEMLRRARAERAATQGTGYQGTEATDKLGIKVSHPIIELGAAKSLRANQRAKYEQARKQTHRSDAGKVSEAQVNRVAFPGTPPFKNARRK